MKSRRQFLQTAAIGGFGIALLPAVSNAACFFDDDLINENDLFALAPICWIHGQLLYLKVK